MNDVVNQVKEQWDIVTEIQKVVQLSKRGQNYVGLCPFHSEKTPSFYVSPLKRIFHCFGCGENGDVISFVMKHEHLSFKEVVGDKATEFNIPHQFSADTHHNSELDKLRDFLTVLQLQYQQWLIQNPDASNYLLKRQIQSDTTATFGLGFSPSASHQKKWLLEMKNTAQGHYSGLFKEDGYPLLQERVIFPIHNSRGIIVGFSGRTMVDGDLAKYINSPESAIFSKKKILYGLHLAKKEIKQQKSAVVVEGYMDVIALHRHGIRHVVGVMGTALTDAHAKELARYTDTVILLFDSDKAGKDATIKSIPALLSQGLSIKIATIGDKDPDDFLQNNSPELMQSTLSKAPFYMDHFLNISSSKEIVSDVTKKTKAVNFLCGFLSKESNKIVKDQYIKTIADTFDVSINVVDSYAKQKDDYAPRPKVQITTDSKFKKAEDVISYLLISNLEFRSQTLDKVRECVPFLADDDIYQLFQESDQIDYEIINQINHSEIKSFLISLIIKFTELNLSFNKNEREEYIKILKQTKIEQRIEEIRSLLGNAQGNQEKELLLELSELIKKIK